MTTRPRDPFDEITPGALGRATIGTDPAVVGDALAKWWGTKGADAFRVTTAAWFRAVADRLDTP